MTSVPHVRLRDRATLPATPVIDVTPFLGAWINTETRNPAIVRIDVRHENETLFVRPSGWPETAAAMTCATAVTSAEGGGYVVDLRDAQLQATLNQGLLVVVVFDRARGRVTREFFRRTS